MCIYIYIYVCMYNWITLLYSRNQHKTISQLYFNFKENLYRKKKKKMPTASNLLSLLSSLLRCRSRNPCWNISKRKPLPKMCELNAELIFRDTILGASQVMLVIKNTIANAGDLRLLCWMDSTSLGSVPFCFAIDFYDLLWVWAHRW